MPIPPPASAPSGLSVSPTDDTLYVALNLRHTVAFIDAKTRQVSELAVGIYPYTTVVTPDGAKVYVSNWGGRRPQPGDVTDGVLPVVVDPDTGIASTGTISVVDAKARALITSIDVGLHPSAMAVSPDGRHLYVANANSDTISVIDTTQDAVERTIDVRLFADAPLGSAPNALAISADGRTLYVANAANNAVAVVELDRPDQPVVGFIPTGWFPTSVSLSADGQKLCVASGYGFGSIAPTPPGRSGRSYTDRVGVVSILDAPDQKQLAAYTQQVLRNNRAPSSEDNANANAKADRVKRPPIPMNLGQGSPIQHVFYIIKENRTYDQVFGDLPQGDGDPSLVQFGRNVTPNHHALAERYVLLDNFYTTGDQSALGHQWANEAYANDYVHKYGNARNDFAGTNPMAYASSGFLWDNARRHGKSVRVYGEFGLNTIIPSNATWSDIYRDWLQGTNKITITPRTRVASLRDILAPRFPGYDMRVTEQRRVDEFLREFREFEKQGNLPNLLILLLPIDHTNGTSPGFPTPRAMVADNDLALGRLVEAISHSRYWPESAILVTEDDAQNGLDHVDGHRTVGLVISPYARREFVDQTLYTT
ncbi:MAG: bifunctional YncE family protein/alkaline phosphatase family protein, partial [Vicinamibacterales bacterium]